MTIKSEKPSGIITQLRIKNFKCFRDVVIPLRPLTIIYGQNSSGKSTIFQAIDMIRLACKMLEYKEADANGDTFRGRKTRELLRKMPWYGSWNQLLHDQANESIILGLSITSEASAPDSPQPVQAIDFELGKDWDARGKGGMLPKSVRMRYWVANAERSDTPDIDINIVTKWVDEKEASRQFAGAVLRTQWLNEMNLADTISANAAETVNVELGECHYFKILTDAEGGAGSNVHRRLSKYILRTWEYLDMILRLEELFNPEYPDTVHVGAGEDYWDRDGQRINRSTAFGGMRKDLYSFLTMTHKSASIGAHTLSVQHNNKTFNEMGKKLIDEVNEAIQQLKIPQMIDPELGFVDREKHNSNIAMTPYNVGHGIQYLVPRLLLSMSDGLVCIEEAEAHVHPRLQANLGKYFLQFVRKSKSQRLVESHSENMLRKIKHEIHKLNQAGSNEAAELSSLVLALYVQRGQIGMEDKIEGTTDGNYSGSQVFIIRLDENGHFADQWPEGFFPERDELYL